MIRRDRRNIGRRVRVNDPGNPYHGAVGTVVGFRGNFGSRQDPREPWVIFRTGADIIPVRGKYLEREES